LEKFKSSAGTGAQGIHFTTGTREQQHGYGGHSTHLTDDYCWGFPCFFFLFNP